MSLPELIEIKNGQPPRPTFTDGEMKARLTKLRNHLKANDIQAAILTTIQNVNNFADFVYCAFGRLYALIVTHDRDTTLTATIDSGQPYRQTFGHDNLVYTDWKKDNFFRGVKKIVPNQGRVGIEYDHVTLERKQKFEQTLDNAQFVDIGVASMHRRMIKSAEAHALISQGARICHIGGAALVEAVHENVPENEVALHATQAMIMLPENMPGAGGYREHEILIVTENGAENITHFPFGPQHSILQ